MRRKKFVILMVLVLLLGGCANKNDNLDSQEFEEVDIVEETKQDLAEEMDKETLNKKLEKNLADIGFQYISGQYSRKVIQEEAEYIETIAIDKNSFLRIAQNEMDKEVFAYNYKSDDFTYLYYFNSELLSKTKFNVETGAIIEDEDGYAELLDMDAQELKNYFSDLMNQANIDIKQLVE